MNTPTQKKSFLRRFFKVVLVALGVCLLPILGLAAVVASCFSLNRDAAALREQVMATTQGKWERTVQFNAGHSILGALGTGLMFVDHDEVVDARSALSAVGHASVGVYQRVGGPAPAWSREALFAQTDRMMAKRGWTRLVGVAEREDTVLIYGPTRDTGDASMDICLAVVDANQLVVVSAQIEPEALMDLIARHMGDESKIGSLSGRLKSSSHMRKVSVNLQGD